MIDGVGFCVGSRIPQSKGVEKPRRNFPPRLGGGYIHTYLVGASSAARDVVGEAGTERGVWAPSDIASCFAKPRWNLVHLHHP